MRHCVYKISFSLHPSNAAVGLILVIYKHVSQCKISVL